MALACAVPACADAAQAKGLCWRHYGRWRRNGDPLARGQHGGRRDEQVQPTAPPDRAPVAQVRAELAASRRAGVPFAEAWRVARSSAPLDWQAVLDAHRTIWRDAYYRAGEPLKLSAPEEPWQPHRRSAPPLVLTGARHDGPSSLEPVEVPWCR